MLNLYKIAYDSSCIIKKLPNFKPAINVNSQWKKSMEDCLHDIEILRSVIAHNNSELNGNREMERLEEYKYWVKKVIGKEEPVESSDYTMLLQELQIIGDKLYSGISEYIEVASQSSEKKDIIKKWEDMIIEWYCGSNATIKGGKHRGRTITLRLSCRRTQHSFRTVFHWAELPCAPDTGTYEKSHTV